MWRIHHTCYCIVSSPTPILCWQIWKLVIMQFKNTKCAVFKSKKTFGFKLLRILFKFLIRFFKWLLIRLQKSIIFHEILYLSLCLQTLAKMLLCRSSVLFMPFKFYDCMKAEPLSIKSAEGLSALCDVTNGRMCSRAHSVKMKQLKFKTLLGKLRMMWIHLWDQRRIIRQHDEATALARMD